MMQNISLVNVNEKLLQLVNVNEKPEGASRLH